VIVGFVELTVIIGLSGLYVPIPFIVPEIGEMFDQMKLFGLNVPPEVNVVVLRYLITGFCNIIHEP
jgi:hypothetical protein